MEVSTPNTLQYFHPFKIKMVQELQPHDLNMQTDSCTKLLEMMDNLLQFLPNLITSDDAHILLSEDVNKQNLRYWAEENPRLLHQSPLHSQQVRVWYGFSSSGSLRPYIF
jgi:hypothetical protein